MRNLARICTAAMLVALLTPPFAQAADDGDDPSGRVARLSLKQGSVSLLPAGGDEKDWTDASLNRPLTDGDRLSLERGARAELQLGNADLHLDGDSKFEFLELTDAVLQASLSDGALHLNVRELEDGEVVEIDTPHAAVVIKRPGEYHVALLNGGRTTLVKTYSGECEVTDNRRTQQIQAREQALIGVEGVTVAQIEPRNGFDAWANERNRRFETSASRRYVAPNVIGYEDLDGHGDWIDDPTYGHVWYPTRVAVDWSPYRHGHWTWISPWGWTWVDHEPWGFAPFHYGRWAYVRSRWCWVPGPRRVRAVYAPALVAWVGGAPGFGVSISFRNIGWFPLAPHEVFVPSYRFSRRHLHRVNYANAVFVNNVHINRVYTHRDSFVDHANRSVRNAVTVVDRDTFVSARPVRNHIVRVDNARDWRVTNTAPAIAPERVSRLAPGESRTAHIAPRWSERQVVMRNAPPARTTFDQEQRAIRDNDNRPVSRGELRRLDANRAGSNIPPDRGNARIAVERDARESGSRSDWRSERASQPERSDSIQTMPQSQQRSRSRIDPSQIEDGRDEPRRERVEPRFSPAPRTEEPRTTAPVERERSSRSTYEPPRREAPQRESRFEPQPRSEPAFRRQEQPPPRAESRAPAPPPQRQEGQPRESRQSDRSRGQRER